MSNQLKVIVKKPFHPFEIVEIDEGLQSYYNVIGCDCIGVIDIADGVQMIYDDEYLLNGSTPNIKFRDPHSRHLVCGTVIFTGFDFNTGETVSLKHPEITKMMLEYLFQSLSPEEAGQEVPEKYTGVAIITFGPIED